MFYIYSDTITISVILKRLRILHHVSNAPDVTNYGLIVPHVIDMKKHVMISVNMNSLVDITKRQRIYLKIYPNDSKKTNFLITILHMTSKVY
jgi:hypothetical protein